MAIDAGRNQPCPCGSGKKYKKCCLARDEAEARRASPAVEVGDDARFEDKEGSLDTRTIARVCYTNGMVAQVADLRRGKGVTVVEWQAPDIPPDILESFELEDVASLTGTWGDPQIGEPIQVDIVDITAEARHLTIEIFNRAILLVHSDLEEVASIHRICETLRSSASGQHRVILPPAGAIRRHRRRKSPSDQPGTCELCGQPVAFAEAGDHALTCAAAHEAATGERKLLVQLDVTAPGLPTYWMRIEARADARLEALDRFLRRTWLECCGHLSMFRVGATEYYSPGFEFEDDDTSFLPRDRPRPIRKSMSARLDQAVPAEGTTFEYQYDFGSTTTLQLKTAGERRGRVGRAGVRLLIQNDPKEWPCAVCGAPATLVCPYCAGDPQSLLCGRHRKQHSCEGADEAFLPVVNSPRMGVCGYTGP